MRIGKKYLYTTLLQALQQGTTPRKLAVTCATGIAIGIFPLFGTTTFLCLVISLVFRLNVALLQLVNYLVTAVQVVLIFPFIQMGIVIFQLAPFQHNEEELLALAQNDFLSLVMESGQFVAAGVGAWAITALPVFMIVYYGSFFLFSQWIKDTGESTPQ